MTHLTSRIFVTLVFAAIYAAFLAETGLLFYEYGGGGLAFQISNLYAQNFVFFPIAGLLALIAFWRPAVLIVDALGSGYVRFGQPILLGLVALTVTSGWYVGQVFNDENSRSLFEIDPAAIAADRAAVNAEGEMVRSPIPEILAKMRINAAGEDGLTPYRSRCDAEWLRFSVAAEEEKLCFPTGTVITVAACCRARTVFREHANALQARAPSRLAKVHRFILPVKASFLMMLLIVGVMLVRLRKRLQARYGKAVDEVSFGVAVGGLVMLLWPLMNAAHLDTISLLVGDGSSNAYRVTAPLIALGFGVFTILLTFFHLRTYPHQVEYAAKLGGAAAAALGVFQYEEIVAYLSQTLGIGGGPVAVVVFTVAVGAVIAAVVMGVSEAFDFDEEEEEAEGRKAE